MLCCTILSLAAADGYFPLHCKKPDEQLHASASKSSEMFLLLGEGLCEVTTTWRGAQALEGETQQGAVGLTTKRAALNMVVSKSPTKVSPQQPRNYAVEK